MISICEKQLFFFLTYADVQTDSSKKEILMHLILLPYDKASIIVVGDTGRSDDSFVKHLYYEGSTLG